MSSVTTFSSFAWSPETADLDAESYELWIAGHTVEAAASYRLNQLMNIKTAAAAAAAATTTLDPQASPLPTHAVAPPSVQSTPLHVSAAVAQQPRVLHQHDPADAEDTKLLKRIVEIDTSDKFRLYEELKPSLEELGSSGFLFQMPPSTRQYLVERFYSFDDAVVRDLLGKKLTSRQKRDIDDVRESTGINRQSCVRQFDNLRRMFDTLDETGFLVQPSKGQTKVFDYLLDAFAPVSATLISRYEAVLFILFHRFNVQSTKKATGFLTLRDFEVCAKAIMSSWCVKRVSTAPGTLFGHSVSPQGSFNDTAQLLQLQQQEAFCPFDLDPSILLRLRDLKTKLSGSSTEVWVSTRNAWHLTFSDEAKFNKYSKRVESKFKSWFKSVLNVAGGLGQPRELRDLFEDVCVDLVTPLVEDMRLDEECLSSFLRALELGSTTVWDQLDSTTTGDSPWGWLSGGLNPMMECVARAMRAEDARGGARGEEQPSVLQPQPSTEEA